MDIRAALRMESNMDAVLNNITRAGAQTEVQHKKLENALRTQDKVIDHLTLQYQRAIAEYERMEKSGKATRDELEKQASTVENLEIQLAKAVDKEAELVAEQAMLENQVNKTSFSWMNFNQALEVVSKAIGLVKKGLSEMRTLMDLADTRRLGQLKFETVAPTGLDTDAIIEYTKALQQQGVVADYVYVAGAQRLAANIKLQSSYETLLPVMGNYLALEVGIGATTQDAESAAQLFGRALEGNTMMLERQGYIMSDYEKNILKTGTEMERVAVLSDIITRRTGEMNAVLAEDNAGQMEKLRLQMEQARAELGEALYPAMVEWQEAMTNVLVPVIQFLTENVEILYGVLVAFGTYIVILATTKIVMFIASIKAMDAATKAATISKIKLNIAMASGAIFIGALIVAFKSANPVVKALAIVIAALTGAFVIYNIVQKLVSKGLITQIPAIIANGTAWWSNPIIIIAAAIALVIIALVGLTAWLGKSTLQTEDFNSSLRDTIEYAEGFQERLDDIQKNAGQTWRDNAQYASMYMDTINRLASVEYKTAGEIAHMQYAVDGLNALMVGLNLTLDEQGNIVGRNIEELNRLAEAYSEAARAQAEMEVMKELTKESMRTKLEMEKQIHELGFTDVDAFRQAMVGRENTSLYEVIRAIDKADSTMEYWFGRQADLQQESLNAQNYLNSYGVSINGGEVGVRDTVSINKDDLDMLGDIATRQYRISFQQLTPQISVQIENVNENADFYELVDGLGDVLQELSESSLYAPSGG